MSEQKTPKSITAPEETPTDTPLFQISRKDAHRTSGATKRLSFESGHTSARMTQQRGAPAAADGLSISINVNATPQLTARGHGRASQHTKSPMNSTSGGTAAVTPQRPPTQTSLMSSARGDHMRLPPFGPTSTRSGDTTMDFGASSFRPNRHAVVTMSPQTHLQHGGAATAERAKKSLLHGRELVSAAVARRLAKKKKHQRKQMRARRYDDDAPPLTREEEEIEMTLSELSRGERHMLTGIFNALERPIMRLEELSKLLFEWGQNFTAEQLEEFNTGTGFDTSIGQSMSLFAFLLILARVKIHHAAQCVDDTTAAFLAVSSGQEYVDADYLKQIVKDFHLTIDADRLLEKLDQDGNGEIEFDEFRALMTMIEDNEQKPAQGHRPSTGDDSSDADSSDDDTDALNQSTMGGGSNVDGDSENQSDDEMDDDEVAQRKAAVATKKRRDSVLWLRPFIPGMTTVDAQHAAEMERVEEEQQGMDPAEVKRRRRDARRNALRPADAARMSETKSFQLVVELAELYDTHQSLLFSRSLSQPSEDATLAGLPPPTPDQPMKRCTVKTKSGLSPLQELEALRKYPTPGAKQTLQQARAAKRQQQQQQAAAAKAELEKEREKLREEVAIRQAQAKATPASHSLISLAGQGTYTPLPEQTINQVSMSVRRTSDETAVSASQRNPPRNPSVLPALRILQERQAWNAQRDIEVAREEAQRVKEREQRRDQQRAELQQAKKAGTDDVRHNDAMYCASMMSLHSDDEGAALPASKPALTFAGPLLSEDPPKRGHVSSVRISSRAGSMSRDASPPSLGLSRTKGPPRSVSSHAQKSVKRGSGVGEWSTRSRSHNERADDQWLSSSSVPAPGTAAATAAKKLRDGGRSLGGAASAPIPGQSGQPSEGVLRLLRNVKGVDAASRAVAAAASPGGRLARPGKHSRAAAEASAQALQQNGVTTSYLSPAAPSRSKAVVDPSAGSGAAVGGQTVLLSGIAAGPDGKGPSTLVLANEDRGTVKVLKLPPLESPETVAKRKEARDRLTAGTVPGWRVNFSDFMTSKK